MDKDNTAWLRNDELTPRARANWKQLADIEIFRNVVHTDIANQLDCMRERTLTHDELLISPQQSNNSVYMVLEGELRVHIDSLENAPITTLSRGEPVGEMSIFAGHPPSAFVVAEGEVRLLEIPEDQFWSMIHSTHAFAINLLFRMAGRVRSSNIAIGASEQRAMVDGLTGAHNRRWLDEMLPRLLERQHSQSKPTCVAMVDVDYFKKFNDKYGHQAGDEVLQCVTSVLEHNVRPEDMVARYGGEEFALLLPDTGLDTAMKVTERVRQAIEKFSILLDKENVNVTASFGVAEAGTGDTAEALLSRADEALYRAKHAGRNRVEH